MFSSTFLHHSCRATLLAIFTGIVAPGALCAEESAFVIPIETVSRADDSFVIEDGAVIELCATLSSAGESEHFVRLEGGSFEMHGNWSNGFGGLVWDGETWTTASSFIAQPAEQLSDLSKVTEVTESSALPLLLNPELFEVVPETH